MRFVSGRDSRLLNQARVQEARKILFGHEQGLPGERWLARPLVSRDMLQWYFPSKYGLQEFRLSEYYEMQAERFRKSSSTSSLNWVNRFSEIVHKIEKNRTQIDAILAEIPEDKRDQVVWEDLKEMVAVVDLMNDEDSREGKFLKSVLMREQQADWGVAAPETRDAVIPFTDKRHRFVDPLFRRRRLKWMERFLAGMNNKKEIRLNRHYTRHPDEQKKWPTNLGSVTVKWPNRRN